ncbi:hypothetical protein RvY_18144 [Ramazzottius varieornatus]|uniref:ENTH domain-containing protein n=1 Tax=Ramazzottius varieornatus TaxID=947166 RepID=A0A1D1W4T9_RAMVA|nr:hypothetical protein RvY_18144 [Ramazzottius varieornatus]
MGDVKRGLRTVRNVVRNYNDAQVKVREATSNDPWGPAASLMADIADMTYNHLAFSDIMQMLWKRLNDNGKDWRHVYKALVVLDYIIKAGTEKVAQHCLENLYFIQTLQNFQYSEDNKDLGMNVREKAKQVVCLLTDDEKLKNERAKASKTRERFQYGGMGGGGAFGTSVRGDFGSSELNDSSLHASALGSSSSHVDAVRPQTANEEEIQLQIALALSKEEAEEEERRRQRDDVRLQLALSESQTDYQKGGKAVQASSADELFDVFHANVTTSSPVSHDPWGDGFDAALAGPASSHSHKNGSHNNDPWSTPAIPLSTSSTSSMQPFTQTKPGGDLLADAWSTSPSAASPNIAASSSSSSINRKQPEAFLGANSSLVNLDALVGGPSSTRYSNLSTATHNPNASLFSNPFGLAPALETTPANPFHHSVAPAPTINQLRNPLAFSQEPASHLPQPLLPLSSPSYNINTSAAQQNNTNSFNPFL